MVNIAFEAMADRYPRTIGDRTQPYERESGEKEDPGSQETIGTIEMTVT